VDHISKRMVRTQAALIVSLLMLTALVAVNPLWTNRPASALPSLSNQAIAVGSSAQSNGVYEVQVLSGGAWKTVGQASFAGHYATRAIILPGEYDRVRLVERGGTAAQIDGVSLDGNPPTGVSGSLGALALKKLRATDNDVTNAYDDAPILAFPVSGSRLEINARIQGDISDMFPFEYPEANSYQPVALSSSFYSYGVSDRPAAIDTRAEPFIQVFSKPGTGHPDGYTYAWVANDGQYLYATMDFTSDNTMDGNEDYAKVHVKTPEGVKDFKISVAERTWGDVEFTYTDKVNYQHKLYSFRIPWSEIGAPTDTVELAFAGYGTTALPTPVYRFFNRVNESHFYTADIAERDNVMSTLSSTYAYEGIAYAVDEASSLNNAPLYRFFNMKNGSHFYTASLAERDQVAAMSSTYTLEGPAYNVCLTNVPGSTPVYRFYNRKNGSHFYTASVVERDDVMNNLAATYIYEGAAFFLAP